MELTKAAAQPDERIGADPPPPTERQRIIEEIVELQRDIYILERKLNELDQETMADFARPPTR